MAETMEDEASRLQSPSTRDTLEPTPAAPTYSRISDKIRRAASGNVSCRLFCGGKRCKYESTVDRMNELEHAIPGLYSSWITGSILAMARPSSFLISEHSLLSSFKQAGIQSLFNLQLAGEHPHCGPGLESSGFTYIPEDFMEQGIFFYNFGWEDLCAPDLPKLLDVVKVMCFSVSKGRAAVHCHAGLGRTGTLIACYLVYQERLSADDAIRSVRSKRPGSIQTHGQVDIVKSFEEFLKPLWTIYSSRTTVEPVTFEQHLSNQNKLLHGHEYYYHRSVPRIVTVLCLRMTSLYQHKKDDIVKKLTEYCEGEGDRGEECTSPGGGGPVDKDIGRGLIEDLEEREDGYQRWGNSLQMEKEVNRLKDLVNSCYDWRTVSEVESFSVLFQLLEEWLWGLKDPFWSTVGGVGNCVEVDQLSKGKQVTFNLLEKIVKMFSGRCRMCVGLRLSRALLKDTEHTNSLFVDR